MNFSTDYKKKDELEKDDSHKLKYRKAWNSKRFCFYYVELLQYLPQVHMFYITVKSQKCNGINS